MNKHLLMKQMQFLENSMFNILKIFRLYGLTEPYALTKHKLAKYKVTLFLLRSVCIQNFTCAALSIF